MNFRAVLALAMMACAPSSSDGEAEQRREAAGDAAIRDSTGPDRLVGLLALPQVFGQAPCENYVPSDVALYADPDSSRPAGVVRVEQAWTQHEYGGCEGLRVGVRLASGDTAVDLPTLEYSYEMPGAIVLRRQGGWFRIRLAEGAGWVHDPPGSEFMAIEDLLANNLTYIAESDGLRLTSGPGSAGRPLADNVITDGQPVRVLQSQTVDGALWLKVAIQSHSPCDSADEPSSITEGWLPAHTSAGEPVVWFYSRGC